MTTRAPAPPAPKQTAAGLAPAAADPAHLCVRSGSGLRLRMGLHPAWPRLLARTDLARRRDGRPQRTLGVFVILAANDLLSAHDGLALLPADGLELHQSLGDRLKI